MPSYKLTYFDLRGRGENIRQILTLAKQEFEDNRIQMSDWAAQKSKFPFGQLPVLEVDGKVLAQSGAINRYLAKKYGFAGSDDWESVQIDALADQLADVVSTAFRPFFFVIAGIKEGNKEEIYKSQVAPARDVFLSIVTKYLTENKSGYLIGDKLSWVDLLMAEHVATFLSIVPEYADNFPEVRAHSDRIRSIPELKKWIESRPENPY